MKFNPQSRHAKRVTTVASNKIEKNIIIYWDRNYLKLTSCLCLEFSVQYIWNSVGYLFTETLESEIWVKGQGCGACDIRYKISKQCQLMGNRKAQGREVTLGLAVRSVEETLGRDFLLLYFLQQCCFSVLSLLILLGLFKPSFLHKADFLSTLAQVLV